jgi:uncharacterized membrane protein YfcA
MKLRALLASPLGFAIGLSLGALGGGGSILAVPVLVFLAGETPAEATTTSLAVVGSAALIGAFGHWRSGRVRVRTGLAFGLVGLPGSLAGSALNRRLDGDVLLLGFSLLMVLVAGRLVAGSGPRLPATESETIEDPPAGAGVDVRTPVRTSSSRYLIVIAGAGTAVGFLTGLFGVGGGFLIVPALALVLRFPMPLAVGTSLLVVALNAAVALGARVGTSALDVSTTLLFSAAAVAGVAVGTRVADRLDARSMRHGFAALMVIVGIYTAGRASFALF